MKHLYPILILRGLQAGLFAQLNCPNRCLDFGSTGDYAQSAVSPVSGGANFTNENLNQSYVIGFRFFSLKLLFRFFLTSILWFDFNAHLLAGGYLKAVNDPDAFISTWKTDNPGASNDDNKITIPTLGSGYNYDVDWDNDGNYDQFGITGSVTHRYDIPDIYTIRIRGSFPRIYFNGGGDKDKLLSVDQWGSIAWTSMEHAFEGCHNLEIHATDAPDLSAVTSTFLMFRQCYNFNQNINHWDVSNVTNMRLMFQEATSFNHPLDNWDVSNATDISGMFVYATAFNQPIGNWDVSSVENIFHLFIGAESFNQPIGNWDVSNATSFNAMFAYATSFNQPIGSWNVASVTNMEWMFSGASSFDQPLNAWDVSNVTIMVGVFSDAISFNQPLDNWDVSNVTEMGMMFSSAERFNQDLGNWSLNSLANWSSLSGMLDNCGMDCTNYSSTLIGWNNNPLTAEGILLTANGLEYGTSAEAARYNLMSASGKGWTIYWDEPSCLPCPCPENMTVSSDVEQCGAIVTYIVTSNENCPINQIEGIPSGMLFPLGVTYNTVEVYDYQSGNSVTCSFEVEVLDVDSDSDGTTDCNDGCPNDVNKTDPGICGCGVSDVDSDSDGTADCNDGCPNDVNKIEPGICGCGVADTDSDNDGTADCNDGCPNDPNKIAPGVCGCGKVDLSVSQAFDKLKTAVENLNLPNCQNVLIAILDDAKSKYVVGNYADAKLLLGDTPGNHFIRKVNTFTCTNNCNGNGCRIPSLEAGKLIDRANDIIDAINNNTPVCERSQDFFDPFPGLRTDTLDLALSPNPAADLVVIQIGGLKTEGLLTVTDLSGRIVWSHSLEADEQGGIMTTYLKSSSLPNGMYAVSIFADGRRATRRLIVQN